MASSPSGSTRRIVHRNPPGGWVDGCVFISARTSNGEKRASERAGMQLCDGWLLVQPSSWMSAPLWSGLERCITSYLPPRQHPPTADGRQSHGRRRRHCCFWELHDAGQRVGVHRNDFFFLPFSFCYKRRHFDYFCMPDAVFCPRVALKRV